MRLKGLGGGKDAEGKRRLLPHGTIEVAHFGENQLFPTERGSSTCTARELPVTHTLASRGPCGSFYYYGEP